MHDEHQVPIWFFIGSMLLIYGVLILGSGIYNLVLPPPPEQRVALFEYHADIWWGVLMIVVGLFYAIRFHPYRVPKAKLEGDELAEPVG